MMDISSSVLHRKDVDDPECSGLSASLCILCHFFIKKKNSPPGTPLKNVHAIST